MRIVIVANTIEELGGAQRVAHSLAREWTAAGHEVDLVGLTPFPTPHAYDRTGFRAETLMSEVWPAKTDSPLTSTQRSMRARLKSEAIEGFQRILSGEPGVIVVTQVWGMEILSDPSLTEHRSLWRIVGQYHGSFAAAGNGRDLGRLQRSYADIDRMLALTQEDADAFVKHGLACEAMPNPLMDWPETPLQQTRPHRITYLGRLSHEKGPDLLANAWELAHEHLPSWSVQYVGTGPMAELIRSKSLPRVTVLDPVTNPSQILASSAILALPSRTEGFPMALAEAQAWGVPAVACDCSSGVRELMGADVDPHGVLVPREDTAEFARGLITLASNEALRSGFGARAHESMKAFRADHVMKRWDDLFARIMN